MMAAYASGLDGIRQMRHLEDVLVASEIVGNVRFNRPTVYIFPGGAGDSSLIGIEHSNLIPFYLIHKSRIDFLFPSHIPSKYFTHYCHTCVHFFL